MDSTTFRKIARLQFIKELANQTAAFLLFVVAPLALFLILFSFYRKRQEPSKIFKLFVLLLGILTIYININFGIIRYLDLYWSGEPCRTLNTSNRDIYTDLNRELSKPPRFFKTFHRKRRLEVCSEGQYSDYRKAAIKIEKVLSHGVGIVLLPMSLLLFLVPIGYKRLVTHKHRRVILSLLLLLIIIVTFCILLIGFIRFDREHIIIRSDIEDLEDIQKAKLAYQERINIKKRSCPGVPLTDRAYIRELAEQGNPEAAYRYSSIVEQTKNTIPTSNNIGLSARKWLKVASDGGHQKASSVLCYSYVFGRADQYQLLPKEHLQLCLDAATSGSKSAYSALARIYKYGTGVEKNLVEAYFWTLLQWPPKKTIESFTNLLTDEEISQVDERVKSWREENPHPKTHIINPIPAWRQAYRGNSLPINTRALVCGVKVEGCKVADKCNDLVGYVCNKRPKYLVINTSTNEVVTSCSKSAEECGHIVPDEWTCAPPNNMPLSKEDRLRFPKYTYAINCGNLLMLPSFVSGMGPQYINKTTGEKQWACDYSLLNVQKNCKKPRGWYCDGK